MWSIIEREWETWSIEHAKLYTFNGIKIGWAAYKPDNTTTEMQAADYWSIALIYGKEAHRMFNADLYFVYVRAVKSECLRYGPILLCFLLFLFLFFLSMEINSV